MFLYLTRRINSRNVYIEASFHHLRPRSRFSLRQAAQSRTAAHRFNVSPKMFQTTTDVLQDTPAAQDLKVKPGCVPVPHPPITNNRSNGAASPRLKANTELPPVRAERLLTLLLALSSINQPSERQPSSLLRVQPWGPGTQLELGVRCGGGVTHTASCCRCCCVLDKRPGQSSGPVNMALSLLSQTERQRSVWDHVSAKRHHTGEKSCLRSLKQNPCCAHFLFGSLVTSFGDF